MLPLIEERRQELIAVCREFGLERLELFGSASNGDFDPERSDLDFLVTYPADYDMGPWLKRHFELKDRLSELFGRRVDLIEAGAPRNPFVVQSIEQTKQLLYAA
jgi:predicted nucleotidyltransferase